jgi:hypothetical protein
MYSKYIKMDTNIVHKKTDIYSCDKCNYNTCRKSQYDRHLLTSKHIRIHENTINSSKGNHTYTCEVCGKEYKFHSGLWKHKKTCKVNEESDITRPSIPLSDNPSLVVELLKQNQEFKDIMVKEYSEMRKMFIEMAGNMGSNHHNTINSNNKFNLNVFLNEKCKNAMSLTDFVKSINLTIEDFIQTGERGFIEGISNIIVERINNMDLHDRPIHCTDLKRETVYIKDSDKWEKDTNKEQLRKAVKGVAYKNERMRPIWYEETPEVDVLGSENCEKFLKYSQSALGGCGKEETKLFEDKVMKNILKEVTIDKDIE